jgi:hypothetical protein
VASTTAAGTGTAPVVGAAPAAPGPAAPSDTAPSSPVASGAPAPSSAASRDAVSRDAVPDAGENAARGAHPARNQAGATHAGTNAAGTNHAAASQTAITRIVAGTVSRDEGWHDSGRGHPHHRARTPRAPSATGRGGTRAAVTGLAAGLLSSGGGAAASYDGL